MWMLLASVQFRSECIMSVHYRTKLKDSVGYTVQDFGLALHPKCIILFGPKVGLDWTIQGWAVNSSLLNT